MDRVIEAMGAGLPKNPEAYQAFAKSQAALLTSALMSAYTLANMWTYHNTGKFTHQLVDPRDPQYFTKLFAVYRKNGTWFSFLQMYGDPVGFADGVKDVVTDFDGRQLGKWFYNKGSFLVKGGTSAYFALRGQSVYGQNTLATKAEKGVEAASQFGGPMLLQHVPQALRTDDYTKVKRDTEEALGVKEGTY